MSLGHIHSTVVLLVAVLCDSCHLTTAPREAERQQQYLMVFGGYPNGTNEVELVAIEDGVTVPECLKGDPSGQQQPFVDMTSRLRTHSGLALPLIIN